MNEQQPFEVIKNTDREGREFWSARDLGPLLDYKEWLNFHKVISKAVVACEASGQHASDHFVESNKMVELGSGANRNLEDIKLSRYACYLIVQNGDPSKPVIAAGQIYFAQLKPKKSSAAMRWIASKLPIKRTTKWVRRCVRLSRISGAPCLNHFRPLRKVSSS